MKFKFKYWKLGGFLCIIFLLTALLPTSPTCDIWQRLNKELSRHSNEFSNPQYAVVIDYNKPVYKRRLWVLDLKKNQVVFNTHVSHAWKSGFLWADQFSNVPGSNTSCKGTFKTLHSYKSQFGSGKYQIGMRIKGLNETINDNALQRNIVFHSSWGFWSSGCYMTLPWINKEIIELTKNGNIVLVL